MNNRVITGYLITRFLLKLFKAKLKTCEQHLNPIGLQLIFLP